LLTAQTNHIILNNICYILLVTFNLVSLLVKFFKSFLVYLYNFIFKL